MRTSKSYSFLHALLPALCILPALAFSQEPVQEKKFFDIALSQDEIYKYTNLKFAGDYTLVESPSGVLALGRTEAGVTLMIWLGAGTVTFEAPEAAREKFTQIFATHPLKTSFKTLYMRLHPKEYEEIFGKAELAKAPNEASFEQAKQIFADKFLSSYHAGDKAILPPYKTRVLDLDTADFGMISSEEGYWLRLNRLSPFGRVYPRDFINPKQK